MSGNDFFNDDEHSGPDGVNKPESNSENNSENNAENNTENNSFGDDETVKPNHGETGGGTIPRAKRIGKRSRNVPLDSKSTASESIVDGFRNNKSGDGTPVGNMGDSDSNSDNNGFVGGFIDELSGNDEGYHGDELIIDTLPSFGEMSEFSLPGIDEIEPVEKHVNNGHRGNGSGRRFNNGNSFRNSRREINNVDNAGDDSDGVSPGGSFDEMFDNESFSDVANTSAGYSSAGDSDEIIDINDDFDGLINSGLGADLIEEFVSSGENTGSLDYVDAWTQDDDEDEDEFAGFDLDSVICEAIKQNASDVHVSPGDVVSFTILGDIVKVPEFGAVSGDVVQRVQLNIISSVLEHDFVESFELDTSYILRSSEFKGRRTRLSVGKTFGEIFLVFRIISDVIPTPEELGISGELLDWASLPSGLVLVCGPTGSGKTTTFASIIRKIQLERPQKIITLEKPIEFVYGTDGQALVTQREIGRDAKAFSRALTSAMRQAPDVIMVGEVRNQEEISELLRAAETGHLALSTIHSSSPPATINRIASMFEGEDRRRVLGSLEDNLRGLCNQVLVKSIDGKSRTAVREVLSVNGEVSRMVGRGDSFAIREYQIENCITMDHELLKAVKAGKCSIEEARSKSAFPEFFDELVAAEL